MGSIEEFGSSKDLETKGVWVTIEHGVRLLVARMNNARYTARMRELMKPHQAELRVANKKYAVDGQIKPADNRDRDDLLESLMIRGMARFILLGWENLHEPRRDEKGVVVKNEHGKPFLDPVEYSEKKAEEYLRKYREFFLLVIEIANDQSLYMDEVFEESQGNS